MTWTTLHGFGLVPWQQVRQLCAGLTCAWADYTGFPQGQCPAQAPPYSHLWGWSATRLARVRIDGDLGVVGLLTTSPDPLPGETMNTEVRTDLAYAINAAGNAGRPERTGFVRVIGPMPVTFVAGPVPAADPGPGASR